MSAELFNSLAGYSVGIPPIEVIDGNGNVVTNVLTSGNVAANTIYASEYKYANGAPLTVSAAGANTQLQFNNNGSFGGIPNVTWNGNILSLGDVSKLSIGGGQNGYFLQTDGDGNLTWGAGGGGGNGVPGGANTQVQFNDSGSFGGDSGFTYDKNTNTLTVANLSVTGNLSSNVAFANTAGTVTNAAQPNITSVGTLTTLNVAGTVTANLFAGSGANLTNIPAGNITGVVNLANYVVQAAQPNITSLGNLTLLVVSGNTNTGNLSVSGNAATTNLNVIGNTTIGTGLTANINSNINFAPAANVNLGDISNLHISGGTNGYVLSTDGAGNLAWTAGGGGGNGSPGGSNTQIQYNDTGTFGGSPFFTFNENTNTVNVGGNLIANALIMGSGSYRFSTSNVYAVTTVSATPNQAIFQIQANTISGIDITVVSTDIPGNKRQISKLSAVVLGSSVNYNEVSTLSVNGYTGDFSIGYDPGNVVTPPQVVVYFSPESANLMSHRMNIIAYDA